MSWSERNRPCLSDRVRGRAEGEEEGEEKRGERGERGERREREGEEIIYVIRL